MDNKKSFVALLALGHIACAGAVCAALCVACKKQRGGISEKAKQAFKTLEKTLSA